MDGKEIDYFYKSASLVYENTKERKMFEICNEYGYNFDEGKRRVINKDIFNKKTKNVVNKDYLTNKR